MPVLAALHIIVSQQYRMEVARVNAFRGGCGGWVFCCSDWSSVVGLAG